MSNIRIIKFAANDIVNIISPFHNKIYISVQECVGQQTITFWKYHVHPTRKKARQPPFEFDFTITIPVI